MLNAIECIIDCLPEPVIVANPDLRILAANQSAKQLFGRNLVGQWLLSVIRQPEALDCIARARGQDGILETIITVSEQNLDAEFKFAVRQVEAPDYQLSGFVLTLTDISKINDAEQIRRDFVANVSHELRSPLTSIKGFIETLKGDSWDDALSKSRFLGIMETETERMSRLVSDLLALSSVEANERIPPRDPVELAQVINQTNVSLRQLAAANDSRIEFTIDPEKIRVYGDFDQLKQVFQNLIENAIKYGGERESVSIAATTEADTARVVVVDQGDGIESIHIPRLTERFYRVDSHRSREVGGTGLGLAIVKHIVNRHRGRLTIESEPGRGSRFTVVLPQYGTGEG